MSHPKSKENDRDISRFFKESSKSAHQETGEKKLPGKKGERYVCQAGREMMCEALSPQTNRPLHCPALVTAVNTRYKRM